MHTHEGRSCVIIAPGRVACGLQRIEGNDSHQLRGGFFADGIAEDRVADGQFYNMTVCHKRGVGEQKHLNIRSLWSQATVLGGLAQVRHVARAEKVA